MQLKETKNKHYPNNNKIYFLEYLSLYSWQKHYLSNCNTLHFYKVHPSCLFITTCHVFSFFGLCCILITFFHHELILSPSLPLKVKQYKDGTINLCIRYKYYYQHFKQKSYIFYEYISPSDKTLIIHNVSIFNSFISNFRNYISVSYTHLTLPTKA